MNLTNVLLAFNGVVIQLEKYLDCSLDGQHSIALNISFNDVFTTFLLPVYDVCLLLS